ncbi:DNA-binding response regulator [Streptosporangium sp. NPDC049644]|uniref:response regulator transcription factor n=1 Tax=Streptosporangium sp. NPDC049644 TaxID=3155507 RepID=UPI00341FC772
MADTRTAIDTAKAIEPDVVLADIRMPGAGGILTEREDEVVALLAYGRTNAEIAAELFLAPGTVKNHIAAIQRKTGSRNRVAIAAWAWATGRTEP